jgi:hypothetical protein
LVVVRDVNWRQQALSRIQTLREQASEPVVHRLFQILLATEVSLGGQYRGMAQKKLNLLQFASIYVAKLSAGPPEVLRCEAIQL